MAGIVGNSAIESYHGYENKSHQPFVAGIVGNFVKALDHVALLPVSPALRGWNSWKPAIGAWASVGVKSHQPFVAGIVGNLYGVL